MPTIDESADDLRKSLRKARMRDNRRAHLYPILIGILLTSGVGALLWWALMIYTDPLYIP